MSHESSANLGEHQELDIDIVSEDVNFKFSTYTDTISKQNQLQAVQKLFKHQAELYKLMSSRLTSH